MFMEMETVLHRAIEVRASDIFIIAGLPLTYKINGRQLREAIRAQDFEQAAMLRDAEEDFGRS